MRVSRAVAFSIAAVLMFAASIPMLAAAEPAQDRVAVIYFHRTQRCPTCQKMGGYTQEVVRAAFAEELKSGKVELHDVDFQNPANEALAKGYKVEGPTLIVLQVRGNKVASYKKLDEIWMKVRDKQAFFDYVESNVRGLLK